MSGVWLFRSLFAFVLERNGTNVPKIGWAKTECKICPRLKIYFADGSKETNFTTSYCFDSGNNYLEGIKLSVSILKKPTVCNPFWNCRGNSKKSLLKSGEKTLGLPRIERFKEMRYGVPQIKGSFVFEVELVSLDVRIIHDKIFYGPIFWAPSKLTVSIHNMSSVGPGTIFLKVWNILKIFPHIYSIS